MASLIYIPSHLSHLCSLSHCPSVSSLGEIQSVDVVIQQRSLRPWSISVTFWSELRVFGFICYIQKGVVAVSCKLHQALDIVVIKHCLESKQYQTAYSAIDTFFELMVPQVSD